MKRIVLCAFAIAVIVVNLCSFTYKSVDKENNDLQKMFLFAETTIAFEDDSTLKKELIDDDFRIDDRLEELLRDFKKLIPDGAPTSIEDISGVNGIVEIVKYTVGVFEESRSLEYFFMMIGVALLFCLSEILSDDIGEASSAVKSASSIILSIPVLYFAKDVILSVIEGLMAGSAFFSGIIPIISSVAAIGVGGFTAGAAAITMNASLAFVSGILTENLLPMATLIFSLSLLSGIDTGQGIGGVSKGVRNWFNFTIGLVSTVVVATLGAQTFLSSSRDGIALRSAKYAISGMIPIVGGTLSGALALLVSGVRLLAGTVGMISVAVLLSVMGAPLVMLLFYRFCIGTCLVLTSFSGAAFGERFFASIKGALDCLIAVLASSVLVYMLEIIILTVTLGNIS